MVEEALEVQEGQEDLEESGEEQQAPPPVPQADPEVEKRARMMGWVDKNSFRGDVNKWRPADEFVARADELMPIMKTQLRKYEDHIAGLQTELQTTRKTVESIVKMSDKANQMAYERALSDIRKQQAQAVAAGNAEEWARLEHDKDNLPKPEPVHQPPPPQQHDQENPMFKRWHTENEWYLSDSTMTRYANAFAQENPAPPGVPYMTWLDNVKAAVEEAFPHKFQNPNRSKPAAVDGGAQRGVPAPGSSKTKNYNDLPRDAKMQCDKYVSQGLYKTRDDYVKVFFEEE
jgi:hypothetical protein